MKERNRIRSENKNQIKEAIAAIEKTAAESGKIIISPKFSSSQSVDEKHLFLENGQKKGCFFAFSTAKKSGDKKKRIVIFEKNQ